MVRFWRVHIATILQKLAHHKEMFYSGFKGTDHPKIKKYRFFILPVELFVSLDCFGVSCLVLEISAVEISAFSQV